MLPLKYSKETIYNFLKSLRLSNSSKVEMDVYLNESFLLFFITLKLIPKSSGNLLEIGANPYFMSMLLRKFRTYKLFFINHFGNNSQKEGIQTVVDADGKEHNFYYNNVNIETEETNYKQGFFDIILFCEVIEHLTNDPYKAILNLKKILKPGGLLIITTPNVSRLENIIKLIFGINIFDRYSAYGPYGRHNREYTKKELENLLEHAGFDKISIFTADIFGKKLSIIKKIYITLKKIFNFRSDWKNHLFACAINSSDKTYGRPSWLYRSYEI